MAYWNDSATSGYVNYLGTNDRTIRPPTAAEQQLAYQREQDAARARAEAEARAAADRERQRQEALARQQREEDYRNQLAMADRQRQQQLQDAARARQQQLQDREYAAQKAEEARQWALNFTGGGSGSGGGGSMGALGSVGTGGGGTGGAGGGAGGPMLLPEADLTAADQASRTQAKERAALRLQSSMRALDTAMGQRGIRGSGLQSAAMNDLVGQSATDESNAELDRLNRLAELRYNAAGRNMDAQNQWNIEQLRAQQWAQERADKLASEQRQLALTLAQFGLRY